MSHEDTRNRASADEVPEKNFGMYDTDYQVDCQDLYVEHFAEDINFRFDADLYFAGMKDALAARLKLSSNSDEKTPLNVIELGTGPGRCLRDLVTDANAAGLPITGANLIGIDRSSAQLRRAASYQIEGPVSVRWVRGEATTFAALPELADLRNSIDYMILFNGGSICHLVEPREPGAMFAQVTALLRPGSGRAWVSLQNENILSRSLTTKKEVPDWYNELTEDVVLVSKAYAGVRYRLEKCSPTQRTDRLMRKTTTLSVFRGSPDREELGELVTRNPIDLTLLCWEEAEFVECIEGAGLKIVKAVEGAWQTYYLLMLL
ncbi:MAG: hypothetical protein Q9197_002047 [Variospora fuerteventurae]